jgi:hypothetical protein
VWGRQGTWVANSGLRIAHKDKVRDAGRGGACNSKWYGGKIKNILACVGLSSFVQVCVGSKEPGFGGGAGG